MIVKAHAVEVEDSLFSFWWISPQKKKAKGGKKVKGTSSLFVCRTPRNWRATRGMKQTSVKSISVESSTLQNVPWPVKILTFSFGIFTYQVLEGPRLEKTTEAGFTGWTGNTWNQLICQEDFKELLELQKWLKIWNFLHTNITKNDCTNMLSSWHEQNSRTLKETPERSLKPEIWKINRKKHRSVSGTPAKVTRARGRATKDWNKIMCWWKMHVLLAVMLNMLNIIMFAHMLDHGKIATGRSSWMGVVRFSAQKHSCTFHTTLPFFFASAVTPEKLRLTIPARHPQMVESKPANLPDFRANFATNLV